MWYFLHTNDTENKDTLCEQCEMKCRRWEDTV